ncbi:hypothetical protein QQS21_004290 [Conoideocrella luteorostrata]|uniref:Ribonuclease H2 subunit B n=1 Tax=Conoideocrella luteorostrata TaxID=1105319 RepID=A0AAJ0FZY7_9HYPO|nr:hypothetical protein QQS21_004290 [Conoideocrella luteorostrata]
MPRTRSTKPARKEESTNTPVSGSVSRYSLESRQGASPRVFILPKAAMPDARIVTLSHPRSGQPSRYLVCPKTGIHEFTMISAPKFAPRSWLIESKVDFSETTTEDKESDIQVETISNSDMFVATMIDPLFLILPSLVDAKVEKGSDEKKRLFLTSDDHFDKLPDESSHLSEMLRWDATRSLIESRMEAICDTVDAGDEKMFRLSEQKLLDTIMEKAKRMSDGGLPPTLEEQFVKKALEAPILLSRSVTMRSQCQAAAETASDSGVSTPIDSSNSQSTTVTNDTNSSFASHNSTAATSFVEATQGEEVALTAMEASPEVTGLQRLRIAFEFICSRYVAPATADQLRRLLSQAEMSSIDFSPLDEFTAKLAKVRAEAVAASSLADYSGKRHHDEEQDEIRQEKKRKLEEEKKRKATESRGVRDLKKVNTSGMMKLSHFFKAK